MFAAVSLHATELNIYASGLNAHEVDGAIVVDYILNAPATSLVVRLSDGVNEPIEIAIQPGTNNANFAKGPHTNVPLNMIEVPAGEYSWEMVASATANNASGLQEVSYTNSLDAYRYYAPQDIVIDSNPESDYFGRIYVSESRAKKPSAMSGTTIPNRGVYIYNADLTFENGQSKALLGYGSSVFPAEVNGANDRYNIKRMAIDEQGYVYVASRSGKAVYRMDPANPSTTFVKVLSSSSTVDAIEMRGDTLYTLEGVGISAGTYKKYYLPSSASTAILKESNNQADLLNFANNDCAIRDDRHGGLWLLEYRYYVEEYPVLVHINQYGVVDYQVNSTEHTTDIQYIVVKESGVNKNVYNTNRGVVAVNHNGNLLAVSCQTKTFIYSINYDIAGCPTSLTKLYESISPGSTIDAVAFDVADNFYMGSAQSERFYAFATPKTTGTNTYTTPARTSNPINWDGNVVNVTSVSLDQPSATLEIPQTVNLYPTIYPSNATDQNVSWSSSNSSVATVTNGVVKAVGFGDATITVTTEDGSFTADCSVSVVPHEVAVNTLYLDQTIAELSGKTVRRALVRGEYMFVLALDNSNDPYLYRINTHTGEVVNIPTDFCTVVDSRGYKLSDIALTSDGVLVGCNKEHCSIDAEHTVTSGHNSFKIYKWTEETAGIFSGTTWTSRATTTESGNFLYAVTGETMTYLGSSTSGKIVVSSVNAGSTTEIRLDIITYSGSSFSSIFNKFTDQVLKTDNLGTRLQLNVAPDGTAFVIDGNANKPYKFNITTPTASFITPSVFLSSVENAAYTNYFRYDGRDLAVSTHFTSSQNDGFELHEIIDGVTPSVIHDAPALSAVSATYAVALGATESGEAYFYVLRDDKLSAYTTANSYTRPNLTVGNLSTICLPYAVAADKIWGAEVYNVASANGSPLAYISLSQEDGDLEAGKPYVIKPTKNTFACIYNGAEQTTVQDANGLIGKLDDASELVDDNENCYIFSGGYLYRMSLGVEISFLKNRAYFDLREYNEPVPAPGVRMLVVPAAPENATGMENVGQTEEVQKFFQDGKFYIRRGNIIYDALGRIVK